MLRTPLLVAFAMSVVTFGCGDDDGAPGSDGGGFVDGGRVGADGGGDPTDGGSPGVDGGSIATDGGIEDMDGGSAATDGGATMAGSGAVGAACMMDVDCDGALVCRTTQSLTVMTLTFPGGYCTEDCGGMGAMCPAGSECAGTIGGFGMGFCAATCTAATTCRMGYECRGLLPGVGGAMYCLPPGGGFGFDGGLPGFP